MKGPWRKPIWIAAGALSAIGAVSWLGSQSTNDPARCASGLLALGPRCCAPGQHLRDGRCAGQATHCTAPSSLTDGACATSPRAVFISSGTLDLSVDDWDLLDRVQPKAPVFVPAFWLDSFEVTRRRWLGCVDAGRCPPPHPEPHDWPELDTPVTSLEARHAQDFCRFAGGQLPTSHQWLWAARGADGRRYPWGAFGLVCRRASFGLLDGPCAQGATGPEWPGSRPAGVSPEGVFDLAGNVAEWTLEEDASVVARGGSYRSRLAAELKSLAFTRTAKPSSDVGFRCAYSAAPPPGAP
jgi:formylglycine-generating enzyme required for sulfatase activity